MLMGEQQCIHFHTAFFQPSGNTIRGIDEDCAARKREKVAVCLGDPARINRNIHDAGAQVWESVGQFKAQTAKSLAIIQASLRIYKAPPHDP